VHTWVFDEWPILAWVFAFFWLACAAFRLARFNVTIDPAADKRYFIGLASPGAAAVVMAMIFALDHPRLGPTEGLFKLWFPLSVSVVPALLMVMTIPFRSFRNLLAPKTPRARLGTATVVVLILVGLVLAPGVTGLLVAYGYVLTAPLGVLTAPLRRRFFGEAPFGVPADRGVRGRVR